MKQLKENWFILAFLCGVAIWYANTNSRLTSVEAKVAQQQTVIEQFADMKTDLAVIKANVDFIKDKVK